MRRCRLTRLLLALWALQLAPGSGAPTSPAEPTLYTYRVVRSYPHDSTCFTQGLVVRPGSRRARDGARR